MIVVTVTGFGPSQLVYGVATRRDEAWVGPIHCGPTTWWRSRAAIGALGRPMSCSGRLSADKMKINRILSFLWYRSELMEGEFCVQHYIVKGYWNGVSNWIFMEKCFPRVMSESNPPPLNLGEGCSSGSLSAI